MKWKTLSASTVAFVGQTASSEPICVDPAETGSHRAHGLAPSASVPLLGWVPSCGQVGGLPVHSLDARRLLAKFIQLFTNRLKQRLSLSLSFASEHLSSVTIFTRSLGSLLAGGRAPTTARLRTGKSTL